ncbi:hypothetical protein LTR37_010719 [Vermiconidia calcicola]|uniref:Uncharacterized protein n=1 Tax=Vermiconidia calcicola TaxID=1690605 RepID=A0ACC3N5P0_9PEZI|nr:hypothetical protein LTR37_010719 [Vermiconidia calcicola]
MIGLLKSAVCAFGVVSSVQALNKDLRIGNGGRTIHDFRREAVTNPNELDTRSLATRDVDPETLYPKRYFDIPIDHFPNKERYAPHKTGTFKNRYWFDASHYKPGGPVIILQSGETNGLRRLVFMQKGILAQLAEATGGIAVVFEHRYYGYSFPTRYLTTEDLRFLSTEQALADEAYFARNVKFPGLEDQDLTSDSVPWISYGGSYAGGMSAFLRTEYPDVFWGAISSSGVTKAIWDYWQYFEPAAQYGPPLAMDTQKLFTDMVDNILIGKADNEDLTQELKTAFGLPNITSNADFANQLAFGVGWWQSLNWDPEVGSREFYNFASDISSGKVLYPKTESKRSTAEMLLEEGGYEANQTLVNRLLNYIGYIDKTVVGRCGDEGSSQDECFSNLNVTFYQQTGQSQAPWRSWSYQYCTEWGYLQTGSGVPKGQMPLVSRTIDLNYTSTVCREAFGINRPARVELVNKYGGYEIEHSRLAFVDGQWDPWRPAGTHAFKYGAPHRESTTSEPFILIPRALHHYDENGRFPNETTPRLPPPTVKKAQRDEREFVQAWVDEWHAAKAKQML